MVIVMAAVPHRDRTRCVGIVGRRDAHQIEIGGDARAELERPIGNAEHGGAGERCDPRPGRREIPVHQRGRPPRQRALLRRQRIRALRQCALPPSRCGSAMTRRSAASSS
jgi:hypothetical protein